MSDPSPSGGRSGSIFGRFRNGSAGGTSAATLISADRDDGTQGSEPPALDTTGIDTPGLDTPGLEVPGLEVPGDAAPSTGRDNRTDSADPEGRSDPSGPHPDLESAPNPSDATASPPPFLDDSVETPDHASAEADSGISDPPEAIDDPATGEHPPTVGPPTVGPPTVDAAGRRIHPGALNHSLPRCLAVANQKGGVGKTTTAVNLGAALAELGYRVLVVDLDPQGNATTGLGVNVRNLDSSVYDVILHDVPIEDVIEPTTLRNLFVVPATIDLAGAEIELVPAFSRELRLKRALETVEPDFDFVLIDCPPSLGLLTVNALAAAREVIVPIQCEYYALEGLGQLLRNVGMVQSNLNNQLEVSTIILTMYDARTKLAEQVADDVREHFGDKVCRNVVPRTVRLSEAPSFGQPIIIFDPTSRGAIAYRELAKEVGGGAPQRVG